MRFLYTLFFLLAFPFVLMRLWLRSRYQHAYLERIGERFGYYPFQLQESIWLHAVSVGESVAAIPLIKALQNSFPHLPLVVTTMTPTGMERIKAEFGDSVIHAYLPYDLPYFMARFLQTIKPKLGIIMERELWPNLIALCHRKNIPVYLFNARLSEKSARSYRYIPSIMREILQNLTMIAAQAEADAKRFISLGASPNRVSVTGNIKFDMEIPPELSYQGNILREQLGKDRFIWLVASTHEGEEEIILAAHQQLRKQYPDALLIVVPRSPDRFASVAQTCEQLFQTVRRSLQQSINPDTAVYLGDTMGELLLMYQVTDVAFVGGSLIKHGGHNMLEPASLAKPILSGPHCFNFMEIYYLLKSANALITVTNEKSLVKELIRLAQNPTERNRMGQAGLDIVTANRGALAKQLALIKQHMVPLFSS